MRNLDEASLWEDAADAVAEDEACMAAIGTCKLDGDDGTTEVPLPNKAWQLHEAAFRLRACKKNLSYIRFCSRWGPLSGPYNVRSQWWEVTTMIYKAVVAGIPVLIPAKRDSGMFSLVITIGVV